MVGGTFADVLNWLGDEESYTLLMKDDYINGVIGSNGELTIEDVKKGDSGSGDGNKVCYASSGALGWILCPVVTAVSGVGEYMWTQIETNFLKVPAASIFDENGGVRSTWEVIRNIANVAFIVLFMIVIFSQLTGVGIDNYGLKKILPRLIVVAILVNLSWIICELAVDLSNIIGTGANSLLTNFAESAGSAAGASAGEQVTAWISLAALGSGGLLLFTLFNPTGAVMAAATIGFGVLGIIISAVVAILTLFLILVIREAGIVLLIVLAPLAIVGYALPNTEKLSKRWFDLLKALLVVYPICGALVGAGKLAGAVLASVPNNPGMKVAATLVQVLPFFLIPMLLKKSLSLMGNIGARSEERRVGK